MKKNFSKVSLVIAVLLLAFTTRYKNFATVPNPGESIDEYSFSWVGLTLIRFGTPVGAIGVGGYQNRAYHYIDVDRIYQNSAFSNPIQINYPWFDHPPLIGLISGGFAYTKDVRVFDEVTTYIIRKPMVVLGTLSVGLLFLLGLVLYDFSTGLIAASVYAVSPISVLGSRMVQAENGLIPVFLLAMLTIALYQKKAETKWLILAGLCAGVAIWFKLSGIVVGLAALILLWQFSKNRFKDISLLVVTSLPFGIALLVYGLAIDWATFINVFKANSTRFYGIGPEAFWELVIKTRITHTKFITDAWMLTGWISGLALWLQPKKHLVIKTAVLCYLAVYLVFGNYPYGWYASPFWPFLLLAFAVVFVAAWKNEADTALPILVMLLPLGHMVSKVLPWEIFSLYALRWKWALGATVLISFLGHRWAKNILLAGVLIATLFITWHYTGMITPDYWYKAN